MQAFEVYRNVSKRWRPMISTYALRVVSAYFFPDNTRFSSTHCHFLDVFSNRCMTRALQKKPMAIYRVSLIILSTT